MLDGAGIHVDGELLAEDVFADFRCSGTNAGIDSAFRRVSRETQNLLWRLQEEAGFAIRGLYATPRRDQVA